MAGAAFLMVHDGRFPTGGHAHSGGLEAAIGSGAVTTAADLERWLRGRLQTTGRVDAAFAAMAWAVAGPDGDGPDGDGLRWSRLAGEYWARNPSPALRAASRAQARGWLRALAASWPSPAATELAAATSPAGPPWAVAFGAGARGCGLSLADTALSVATASVQGPAWAATRLTGMDPYAVTACLARLAPEIDAVAGEATAWGDAEGDAAALPASSAPLLDIGAEVHRGWEVRLFAS